MASLNPSELFSVKGLVAVITGGGTGIGLMIAQALEANGAVVYILGRRKEMLEKAVGTAKHSNIRSIQADVTSKSDLSAAVTQIEKEVGYVNLVVANSGISGPQPPLSALPKDAHITDFRAHLWDWDIGVFNDTFAVNCTAVFYTITAFLELLDKGNKAGNVNFSSQVIAISSIGGFNRIPLAGYAYGSSKAAVTHMMKQFATGLVPYDIRANVIAPGAFPSEMTEQMLKERETKGWDRSWIPERRAGDIQDMGGAALFLCSRAGAYINGNVLIIDGGRLNIIPATY